MARTQAAAEDAVENVVKLDSVLFQRVGAHGNHFEFGIWTIIYDESANLLILGENADLQDVCLHPNCSSNSCIPISEEVRKKAIKYVAKLLR